MRRRADKAPPIVRRTDHELAAGDAGDVRHEGEAPAVYVETVRGRMLVGVVVHELERPDLERAFAGAILLEPVEVRR